jgi:glycerate-2-kinase
MPAPGISIEDVRRTTCIMQIERGAPTRDLNPIRNHVDLMKGGRVSSRLHPATMIHIIGEDPNQYDRLLSQNFWIATLPDCTTFNEAISLLKKWRAWDMVPSSVRRHLEAADPRYETVKAKEFEKMSFRIFGVMPRKTGMVAAAKRKAIELGLRPVLLAEGLQAEASQAGLVLGTIAKTAERTVVPLKSPCVLLTCGELLVTVGREKGVGGRNQEFVLSAALRIAGSENIVIGAVDSDGTDGPSVQLGNTRDHIPCLAGGIVDGETVDEAKQTGVHIEEELKKHNSTPVLWKLKSGIITTKGISVDDISVALISRPYKAKIEG